MDNYEGPPPAALPPPTSIASRFSSEASIAEAAATRSAEWKAAYERLGQVAPEKEEEGPYDGRSLWEKLQEHKVCLLGGFVRGRERSGGEVMLVACLC